MIPDLFALLAAGIVLGLGIEVARALLAATRAGLDAVYHAARWHVWRPLVRRYYLARLARHNDPERVTRYSAERAAALARHPAGKGHADAHNRALS